MIAKSDVIIIAVSATLLTAGIYRWQSNMNVTLQAKHMAVTSSRAQPAIQQPGVSPIKAPSSDAAATIPKSTLNGNTASVVTERGMTTQAVSSAAEQSAAPVTTATQVTSGSDSQADEASAIQPVTLSGTESVPLFGVYRVVSGDSLSIIASRFGTTVETLRELNDISGSLILIGQEIRFPLPAN